MAVKEPGKHNLGGGRFQPRLGVKDLCLPKHWGVYSSFTDWDTVTFSGFLGVFAVAAQIQWLLVLTGESPTSSLGLSPQE